MATKIEQYIADVKKAKDDTDTARKSISPLVSATSAESVAWINDEGDLVLSDLVVKKADVIDLAKFINANYV